MNSRKSVNLIENVYLQNGLILICLYPESKFSSA